MLIILKTIEIFEVLNLVLEVSFENILPTDEDIFRIFSWIEPWGQT